MLKSLKAFFFILTSFILTNIALFEIFGSSSNLVQKELQCLKFLKETGLDYLHLFAQYIHSRSPWLEEHPYSRPEQDGRLSTWFLPPHQVIAEWMFFVTFFISTLVVGSPNSVYPTSKFSKQTRIKLFVLQQVSLWTLVAVIHYKFRASLESGEWFAPLYLFQPCHVLITAYIVLLHWLLRSGSLEKKSVVCFQVLFDLQWFTYIAVVVPDMDALIKRNLFGEYFLFYFEHFLLMALPLFLLVLVFKDARQISFRDKLYRSWYSLTWFGIHHIQVMTPVSLVSGVQINYQTHLPIYAHHWFRRAYKPIVTLLSFSLMIIFALLVEPALRKVLYKFDKLKGK
jgi:hypothetical protein